MSRATPTPLGASYSVMVTPAADIRQTFYVFVPLGV